VFIRGLKKPDTELRGCTQITTDKTRVHMAVAFNVQRVTLLFILPDPLKRSGKMTQVCYPDLIHPKKTMDAWKNQGVVFE
jgi:hypothetical protein